MSLFWRNTMRLTFRKSLEKRTKRRQSVRPTVEGLEDRVTPSVSGPPFDFSDAFYLANGIAPSKIMTRVGGPTSASAFVVESSSPDANHNNIRITETTGGFDRAGTPLYYTINGMVNPDTFTNDAAGQAARQIAEKFEAY